MDLLLTLAEYLETGFSSLSMIVGAVYTSQLRLVKGRSQMVMALGFEHIGASRQPCLVKGVARKFSEATGQLPRTRAVGR